jgi:hypothetical protein
VCRTKAKIEEDRRASADTFDRYIDRNRRNNVKSDGGAAYTRHGNLPGETYRPNR